METTQTIGYLLKEKNKNKLNPPKKLEKPQKFV